MQVHNGLLCSRNISFDADVESSYEANILCILTYMGMVNNSSMKSW